MIFASLKIDGDSYWQIKLLKLEWRNSIQRSAFFLIILDGISESWQAFHASKFKTSFKISSLSTHLKANWEFFLHTSPTMSILAWSLTMFEKKVFKILAVPSLFFIVFWVVRHSNFFVLCTFFCFRLFYFDDIYCET